MPAPRVRPRPETFRQVRDRLASAQKPAAVIPWYLRHVNRRLGGWLAAAGYVNGRTPNQWTAVSAGLSGCGALLLALLSPSALLGVVCAVLLLAGYAFDSADGQLARLRGGGDPSGEWIDHVVDIAKTCLIHSCVLIGLWRADPDVSGGTLLIPLVFLGTSVTFTFGTMLRDQLVRAAGPVPKDRVATSTLKSVLLQPLDHSSLCLVLVLWGHQQTFVVAYGLLTVVTTVLSARTLVRCVGVLRALRK